MVRPSTYILNISRWVRPAAIVVQRFYDVIWHTGRRRLSEIIYIIWPNGSFYILYIFLLSFFHFFHFLFFSFGPQALFSVFSLFLFFLLPFFSYHPMYFFLYLK